MYTAEQIESILTLVNIAKVSDLAPIELMHRIFEDDAIQEASGILLDLKLIKGIEPISLNLNSIKWTFK